MRLSDAIDDTLNFIFERCSLAGTQVSSAMWGSDTNILVGLHDDCYSIWYCPGEACMDPTVIALTTLTFEFDRS